MPITPPAQTVLSVKTVQSIKAGCLLLLCIPQLGCAATSVPPSWRLPGEISESSGLTCGPRGIFTLNDSGNQSVLFRLTEQGELHSRYRLDARNKDWEALTADDKTLYIGDIGNNSGARSVVQIYRVPFEALTQTQTQENKELQPDTLSIRYLDRPAGKLRALQHDFDAEALVARDHDLLLISKSWQSDTTRIYAIDKHQPQQTVAPVARLSTPGWLVTGAAWNPEDNSLLLIGYGKKGFPFYSPVLARVAADFSSINTVSLPAGGQVEGICLWQGDTLLYTQENTLLSAGRLFRLPLSDSQTFPAYQASVTGAAATPPPDQR